MREDLERQHELPKIAEDIVKTCDELGTINHIGGTALPSKEAIIDIIEGLKELIYPGYFGRQNLARENVAYHIGDRLSILYRKLCEQLWKSLRFECRRLGSVCTHCEDRSEENAITFLKKIPRLRAVLSKDVQAAYDGDPAAKSLDEIIFSYPCMEAITVYRLAHELYIQGIPLMPRIMTEYAHSITGIDIHPGAVIGENFFIDHGTGVVIGETCKIGNNVKIYQGVTLGALSFPKDLTGQIIRGRKRHPTIEDDVTIYAGATILGGRTLIGRGAVIGGNVWITSSVPAKTKVLLGDQQLKYSVTNEGDILDFQI